MELPEFELQTLEAPHLYSHGQIMRANAFAAAIWMDVYATEPDRRKFVLCEPPALKERA
jgi:hypothetical protein